MKHLQLVGWRGLLSALFVVLVSGTALMAAPLEGPGQFIASVPAPTGLSTEQVRDAAVMALVGREWAIDSKTDDTVVGYLKHRSNEALVTLKCDTKKVDVYCVGYEINKKTGERKKPELPNGWLNNLKSDLNKHMARATAGK